MFAKLKYFFLRRVMQKLANNRTLQTLPEDVKKIAVWQFGGLGDMLLATPVIVALSEKYPQADICVWCSYPQFAIFLRQFPSIKKVQLFPIYDFDIRTLLSVKKRQKLKKITGDMQAQHIDILVNLHIPKLLDWWAVEWFVLAKIKPFYTLGFDPKFIRGSIFDISLSTSFLKGMHYTKAYQQLLTKAGIGCDKNTHFPISQSEKERASLLLCSVENKPWVCLHMGGRRLQFEDKMWEMENFSVLAKKLVNDGMIPVLIGVESEQEMGDVLCENIHQTINLIGKTSMGEMAAVVGEANLLIGHDSGPFHIAVAVQTPVVVICGRPDAEPEYLKYDNDNVVVLTGSTPQKISVEQVYQAAKSLLL